MSVQLLVECKSFSLFCTYNKWKYEVDHLQSIFTIKDRVYIRTGTNVSMLWVYDINSFQVLEQPIMASDMFPGYPIVEFVSAVICDNCPDIVSDLVIVVGRKTPKNYHKFGTFRLQSDGSFLKIGGKDLPRNWGGDGGLRQGDTEFTLNEAFYGFFPEGMVTKDTNSSWIHGFAFIPSQQIFILKYFTEKGRYFMYRKLKSDGSLTDWKETGIQHIHDRDGHVLNSVFYIKDKIYTINNDPQHWPRISHEIIVDNKNEDLIFRYTDVVSNPSNILTHFYMNSDLPGRGGQSILQLLPKFNILTTDYSPHCSPHCSPHYSPHYNHHQSNHNFNNSSDNYSNY